MQLPREGRARVVIEGVWPEIDCGRFPAKRIVGEPVVVEADAFVDGHEALTCVLLYRRDSEPEWREAPMEELVNDRWRGTFSAERLGRYRFTVLARVDTFGTWRRDLRKRLAAGQDVSVDLEIGAQIVHSAAERADSASGERKTSSTSKSEGAKLHARADRLANRRISLKKRTSEALDPELAEQVARHPDRTTETRYKRELELVIDRPRARFSSWYEVFPRSCGPAEEHGTFSDLESRLPDIAEMGFDVVYLPPIHPIGRINRKGKNNARSAAKGDVGSPWAIGSDEGGHTAVHPRLGTLEDFVNFRERAEEHGLEVALDIAFQAAPDHPWVAEHPEWFRSRPDGTIQYAENPPKKYEDIYPFDFDSAGWRELWAALRGVFEFWIERGVKIFRVDNPHTKPFAFWEWAIGSLKEEHPDLIFLAEAFTRPKIMNRLAKLGFTQSYTYFAWRNGRDELEEYLTELTRTEAADFFRPNFWPNTPDILTEYLQTGGRGAFMSRVVLAGTLSSNYGIYGPAYELQEHRPREEGSEEYLDSEKYQLRDWDLDSPRSLRDFIARLNAIRHRFPALQRNDGLRFHRVDNPALIAYSKRGPDGGGEILTVVNLDPANVQSGWLHLALEELRLRPDDPFQVHDLLSDERYEWRGSGNYVELDPAVVPAHIFRIGRRAAAGSGFEFTE